MGDTNPRDPINSAARKQLRSLGRSLPVSVRIGARGLTPAAQRQVAAMFVRRELVKVRLPAGAADRRALTDRLAAGTGAAVAGVVGRTVLLYRPNRDLPEADRIQLP